MQRGLLVAPAVVACMSDTLAAQERDHVREAEAGFPALSLEYVLGATLEHSFALERNALQLRARQGELRATTGTFDSRLTTSVLRARDVRAGVPSSEMDGPALEHNTTGYAVSLQKTFRSGITVTPRVGVNHLAVNAATPYSTAAVSVDIRIPLLRDRGGRVIRTTERTVARLLQADTHALRHTRSTAVFAALTAYWRYAASFARLEVQRAAAERAGDLVRETEALVEAGESPPADLNHVQGILALKRAAVLSAEQSVVAMRGNVGLVMGLPGETVLRLGRPTEVLPAPAQLDAPESLKQSLVALALRNRADLSAAGERTAASAVLEEAARHQTRRGLDLSLSTGYTGIGQGPGYDPLYSALVSNVRGLNVSVGLQWEAQFTNSRAHGTALQRSAQHEDTRLAERDLARQIAVDVVVGLERVEHSSRSVGQVAEAVRLGRITLENERVKHRLGSATLFDVILAENNLTSALLNEVTTRLDHAIALADLRYQTATLLPPDGVMVVEHFYAVPRPTGW